MISAHESREPMAMAISPERRSPRRGFTLIELLIVVAIIAILAAIAVPNFLEAQTRAKVSRVENDFRTIITAMEAYRVDNNDYIPHRNELNEFDLLTTPIAYMTSIPECPFAKQFNRREHILSVHYHMESIPHWSTSLIGGVKTRELYTQGKVYLLWSIGPNLKVDVHTHWLYDATNGTRSAGSIVRWGPA